MSNEISIFEQGGNNLPAHLQQYAKQAETAAQMVTGFNSLPKISLRGKQFRYMKDDKEFTQVVLAVMSDREYDRR